MSRIVFTCFFLACYLIEKLLGKVSDSWLPILFNVKSLLVNRRNDLPGDFFG